MHQWTSMNGLDTFISHTLHFTNSPIELFWGTSHPPISLICPLKLFQTVSQYIHKYNYISYMSSTCCWLSELLINWCIFFYFTSHQQNIIPNNRHPIWSPKQCIYIYIYMIIFIYTYIRIVYEPDNKKIPQQFICSTPKNHHQQWAICDPPIPISASSRSASTSAFCASDLAADSAATASSAATDSFTWRLGRWGLDVGGLATCFWGVNRT